MYETGGRTVAVHPETQIVLRVFPCVTRGLIAPGVNLVLGRPEFSEYIAAPQADKPMVAAMTIPEVMSADPFEVRLTKVDSQRLFVCRALRGIDIQTHL